MSARLRVILVVAAAAAVAAGAAVGVTLATRTHVPKSDETAPRFFSDPTAPAVVSRDVREALNAWPSGTARRLRIVAEQHPRNALVRFELGLALAFGGQPDAARQAWRDAERVQADSPSAVRAEDALHPEAPPGKPPFVASFRQPHGATEQLLARGIAFQASLRPVSAERLFAAAVERDPSSAEAQVAAAVGRYDKDHPERAFSQLGPLVRRFPHAQTVRFHLGLLLIYLRLFPQARKELRLAVAEGPKTPLAKQAGILLNASRKR
jgi:tetratricopeptide (TPR) repeat protein